LAGYFPTVRLTRKPFLRFLELAFGLCLITNLVAFPDLEAGYRL